MAPNMMSDAEWAFYELFIDIVRQPNGHRSADPQLALDGIFRIARTGAAWRDLPPEFGKWSSVYRQFRRWTLAGLWDLILEALNDGGADPDEVRMVDNEARAAIGPRPCRMIVRFHQHAVGSKKWGRKKVLAARKVAFRQRSTCGSTASLVAPPVRETMASGLPMRTEITPGRASDDIGYRLVMADTLPAPRVLIAGRH